MASNSVDVKGFLWCVYFSGFYMSGVHESFCYLYGSFSMFSIASACSVASAVSVISVYKFGGFYGFWIV